MSFDGRSRPIACLFAPVAAFSGRGARRVSRRRYAGRRRWKRRPRPDREGGARGRAAPGKRRHDRHQVYRWCRHVAARPRDRCGSTRRARHLRGLQSRIPARGVSAQDFMEPDRIVLGYDDPRRRRGSCRNLRAACRSSSIVHTSTTNAELSKHAANAFLALKIGFVNEVADLCERVGGDISAVARSIGLDRRIGSDFLKAGPGFGGSCFRKTRAPLRQPAGAMARLSILSRASSGATITDRQRLRVGS